MKRSSAFIITTLLVLGSAAPALAAEDGIVETSSFTPSEDLARADFARTVTNASEIAVDVAPRDLRMPEYPTMTATEITVGSFADGIWTIGRLDPGQSASIAYDGVAPDRAAASGPKATEREELPFTGPGRRLATLAIVGFGLIALGIPLLRTTRA